jgi:surface antigen
MSSFDERDSSDTNGLQVPGLVTQLSPAEQVPFPQGTPLPGRKTQLLDYTSDARVSGPLADPGTGMTSSLPEQTTFPGVTWILPEIHTGTLPSLSSRSTTTSLRLPVVIRPTHKKGSGTIRPPMGRKWVISIAAISLLFVITIGTAFAVSPLGNEHGFAFGPLQMVAQLVHNNSNNPSLVAQMATATAITRTDGYDPTGTSTRTSSGSSTSTSTSSGSPLPPPTGGGGLNRFAFGQCTYWANMRYHQLTGYWVPWLGNAYQWSAGAAASGWIVSSMPKVPSIIVLQPGVQGAGGYGHVAVVERINSDGSVYTSNMNWNGGWDVVSYVTFTRGPGVSFVSHP